MKYYHPTKINNKIPTDYRNHKITLQLTSARKPAPRYISLAALCCSKDSKCYFCQACQRRHQQDSFFLSLPLAKLSI